jgi:DNA-binding response OmpR family regulator
MKRKTLAPGTMIGTFPVAEPLMRILLVEDDPDLSRPCNRAWSGRAWSPTWSAAWPAALALREPVHQLMLLDRQLPDGDGAGFVAVARALPNWR